MLSHIRKIIPQQAYLFYHYLIAGIAIIRYANPSRNMVVIGVTGTKGKTSACIYLHRLLSASGKKVGLLSTAKIGIGKRLRENKSHMTMPGRGHVQKKLREFSDAGCRYAIVETSSEGIRQYRNLGVHYDTVVFTNLAPEHLVTHKTFENYRDTKIRLFTGYAGSRVKRIKGYAVKRFALINCDDQHAEPFIAASKSAIGTTITFGASKGADKKIVVKKETKENMFSLAGEKYTVPYPGIFSVFNVVPAIILAQEYENLPKEKIQETLYRVELPGRLEKLDEGQDFVVYCDYAHEPLSIRSVAEALRKRVPRGGKLILSVGAVGGGRWKYNASEIGRIATIAADYTVMTMVDPFFDDPELMLAEMKSGSVGEEGVTFVIEPDRRKAIQKTFAAAQAGDVVVITGKGAEYTYEEQGVSRPWDERKIIRQELKKLIKRNRKEKS